MPARPATSPLSAVAFAAALVGGLALLAWLDVFAAGILFRGPVALILCAPFVVAAVALMRRGRWRWRNATGAAAAIAAIVLLVAPWHPRKRFARTLDAIQHGMPVADVQQLMEPYLAGPGRKWEQVADWSDPGAAGAGDTEFAGTLIWRWNDRDAAYDSDFGEVTFARGRVTGVAFLPD